MNIKIFKILFNRAYRLSGTDNDKAIKIYLDLL